MDATAAAAEAACVALSGSDTAAIQAAERALKSVLGAPGGGLALLTLSQHSAHEAARQLACVLLRKRIVPLWNRAKGRDKDAVKALLLQRLGEERSRPVRKSLLR